MRNVTVRGGTCGHAIVHALLRPLPAGVAQRHRCSASPTKEQSQPAGTPRVCSRAIPTGSVPFRALRLAPDAMVCPLRFVIAGLSALVVLFIAAEFLWSPRGAEQREGDDGDGDGVRTVRPLILSSEPLSVFKLVALASCLPRGRRAPCRSRPALRVRDLESALSASRPRRKTRALPTGSIYALLALACLVECLAHRRCSRPRTCARCCEDGLQARQRVRALGTGSSFSSVQCGCLSRLCVVLRGAGAVGLAMRV